MVALAIVPIGNFVFGGGALNLDSVLIVALQATTVGVAGFSATHRAKLALWKSALAGVVVFFVGQLVICLWFVVDGQLESCIQVARGFAMLVWLPAIVGLVGGLLGIVMGRKGERSRRLLD